MNPITNRHSEVIDSPHIFFCRPTIVQVYSYYRWSGFVSNNWEKAALIYWSQRLHSIIHLAYVNTQLWIRGHKRRGHPEIDIHRPPRLKSELFCVPHQQTVYLPSHFSKSFQSSVHTRATAHNHIASRPKKLISGIWVRQTFLDGRMCKKSETLSLIIRLREAYMYMSFWIIRFRLDGGWIRHLSGRNG